MKAVNLRSRYAPRSPITLNVLVIPLAVLTLLQLGSCARRTAPPPPGGTYLSTSAGAQFDQVVGLEGEAAVAAGLSNIARFNLGAAHRSSDDPQRLYVAAAERGLVVSTNGGQVWQLLPTPLTATFDVVVLANGTLVVSGTGPEGQGYLLRSLDEGKSWQTVLTIPVPVEKKQLQIIRSTSAVASVVLSLELDPFDHNHLYAGSNLGTIFSGEQSAKVWRTYFTVPQGRFTPTANQEKSGVARLIASPHRRGELLLITNDQRLLRVRDRQLEEIKVPRYIRETAPLGGARADRKVLDATYVLNFPDALFVGVEDGAVISRDGGVSWLELDVPVEATKKFNSVVVRVSPTNASRLLVAVNDVIYRSEDNGQTWNTFSLNLPDNVIVDLLIDPTNAARVLAVTRPLQV